MSHPVGVAASCKARKGGRFVLDTRHACFMRARLPNGELNEGRCTDEGVCYPSLTRYGHDWLWVRR